MISFFKAKPVLPAEEIEFQLATYRWLLKNFGGNDFYHKTQLILPTDEFFPARVDDPEEIALSTFEMVKRHAGLEDWPCKLVAQEEDVDPLIAPATLIENVPNSPLGTFSSDADNQAVITYNPALTERPEQLVSTFAHELAHYLTSTAYEPPPGGWENWEFATDIAATFLGFGVFMANSAFNFSQYTSVDSQGWKVNSSGYLTEAEHIYALSLFLLLKGSSTELASKYLKPNLKKLLKRTEAEIVKSDIIKSLRQVESN